MNSPTSPDLPLDSIDDILKKLTLAQLKDLHDKVVEYMTLHRELNRLKARSDLRVGDKVRFTYEGISHIGTITKKNPKTISVYTDDLRYWKISPLLLSKIKPAS